MSKTSKSDKPKKSPQTPNPLYADRGVTQHGRRIDCTLNGCKRRHVDDGRIVPARNAKDALNPVNGHKVTPMQRTLWPNGQRSAWKPVPIQFTPTQYPRPGRNDT